MAGIIQRVYNSTLGLPQQIGMRIWRKLRNKDYNLFDEDGLIDKALIPFFGMLDDHENDASGRDFTDHAGKAFAIDVLTDPVTYATSGLTAVAKASRAAQQVKNIRPLASKVRGLEAEGGIGTVQDLIDLGRKTNLPADQARLVDDLASKGADFLDTPLNDLVGQASERELALAIPFLGRAGMSVAVPTAHKSWFGLMNSGYKALGNTAITLSGSRHIPVVRGVLDKLERGSRAITEGVRAAAEPAVRFGVKSSRTGLDAASDLLNDSLRPFLAKRTAKMGHAPKIARKGWASRYEEMLKRKDNTAEAFLAALGFRVGKKSATNEKKAQSVLRGLTGQTEVAFPQTGEAFEAMVKGAQQDVADAHIALREGSVNIEVVEDLPKFLEEGAARWESFIFEKARATTQGLRKALKTDIPGSINEKAAAAHKTAVAGNSEAVMVMARRGLQARQMAARAEGVDPQVYNRAINALFEGTPTPEELSFGIEMARQSEDGAAAFLDSLISYRTRSLNATNALLKTLRHRGVKVGRNLDGLVDQARLAPARKHIDYENFIRDGGEELVKSGRLSPTGAHQLADGEYIAFLDDKKLEGRLSDLLNRKNLSASDNLDLDAIDTELLLRSDSAFGHFKRPPNMRVGPRDFSEAQLRDKAGRFRGTTRVGRAYGRMAAAIGDLDDFAAKVAKNGGEIRGDGYAHFLDRLETTMAHYGAEVEDIFRAGFKTKQTAGFLDYMRDIQKMSLRAAIETGMVGQKGAPIGYVPRLFSGNSRRALRRLGSDMDTKGVLDAALPHLGPAHKRRLEDLTIDQLNALHADLLAREQPELAAKLGEILETEGLRFERLESDPVLAFLNNYSQKATTRITGGFVDELLKDPRQQHLVSGKISGVFEIGEEGLVAGKRPLTAVDPNTGSVTISIADNELPMSRVGVVMEAEDGSEMVISAQSLLDSDLQFAELGAGAETAGQAFALSAARGELRSVGMGSLHDLTSRVGKRVVLGNGKVVSGLMSTVTEQYKRAPDALRVFDSVNTAVRAAQTIMRPAFHVANAVSGYFQSAMLGTTVRNNSAGHILAGRILFGDESAKAAAAADRHLLMLGEAGLIKRGKGARTIADTVRALGSGEIPAGWADEVLDLGGGKQIGVRDLFQEAADGGLLGTFFARGFAGTSTTSESMIRMARRIEKGNPIDDIKGLGEVSELLSRFGTYLGRVMEHGDLRLAVQETKLAMVDYSDLTHFEKTYAKRLATYYTFSRKYMPFALEQFGKSPRGIGLTAKAIQDSGAITTANGRVEVKGPGDRRINLQRLNANLDAFMLAPALLERFVSPPELTARTDAPSFMAFGGVSGLVMGSDELFVRDEKPSRSTALRDAFYTTFATKWAYQGAKFVTEGEQVSVLDEMERFFLPSRKIKGGFDERKQMITNFRKLVTSMQYEANETQSTRRRKFLIDEANRLHQELEDLLRQEDI